MFVAFGDAFDEFGGVFDEFGVCGFASECLPCERYDTIAEKKK